MRFYRMVLTAGVALLVTFQGVALLRAQPSLPDKVEVFQVGSVGFVLATSPDGSDVEMVKFCLDECDKDCEAAVLEWEIEDTPPEATDKPGPTSTNAPAPKDATPTSRPGPTATAPKSPPGPTATATAQTLPTATAPGSPPGPTATAQTLPTATVVRPIETKAPQPAPTWTALPEPTSRPALPLCGEGKVRICKAGHTKSQCVSESSLKGRNDDYSRGACPGE